MKCLVCEFENKNGTLLCEECGFENVVVPEKSSSALKQLVADRTRRYKTLYGEIIRLRSTCESLRASYDVECKKVHVLEIQNKEWAVKIEKLTKSNAEITSLTEKNAVLTEKLKDTEIELKACIKKLSMI